MIIEMDVLRMLARKVGNLHEERSVPCGSRLQYRLFSREPYIF